ncbi:hypothetical protein OOK06_36655 [Streptomyces sp. NBC_00340]|uniref:hypothetical protein n=1 Tax=Streptomyces sp. NBC_00340 TaxID=2975716 RepID=UPI002253C2FD|nr:hypothetical protein [Streptomyces sp. NBC_00340]MCX5137602.1 hypothetical protein [Streptomyces sp. NBC_00340]
MIDPDGFRPLPIRDERTDTALTAADAKLAEANRLHGEAQSNAKRIVDAARSEASQIREQARAESERRQKQDDSLDTWAARAIIAGTVGLTASGEYALARMAGFDPQVAWLFPFVIDVYVIQAFRRHRDIIQAISLTVAANVTYHLADAGLFGVTPKEKPEWWLIAMVASVASLILWRVHLMTAPPTARREPRKRRQESPPPAARSDRQEAPATPTEVPPTPTAKTPTVAANSDRQEARPVASPAPAKAPAKKAVTGDKKVAPKGRQKAPTEKAPRRSMAEWVALAEPVFHAEFKRLKRNPTASEFADALSAAGHGRPSDSTAKNIRTEILDRAELPALD